MQARLAAKLPVELPAKALAQLLRSTLEGVWERRRAGNSGLGARKSARDTLGGLCGQDWLQSCPQSCPQRYMWLFPFGPHAVAPACLDSTAAHNDLDSWRNKPPSNGGEGRLDKGRWMKPTKR